MAHLIHVLGNYRKNTVTGKDTPRKWSCVALSIDGQYIVACVNPGFIYTSSDYGVSYTQRDASRAWNAVASSTDGMNLVACVYGGYIYTSKDSGANWTARDPAPYPFSHDWTSVASSET
jgi:hypothetical protein